jgi:hypothetical protein
MILKWMGTSGVDEIAPAVQARVSCTLFETDGELHPL